MIKIKASGDSTNLAVKIFKFPGGEMQLSFEKPFYDEYLKYEVTARLNSSDDIMELLLLDEILQRRKHCKSILTIPYLPYGRQDRVMHDNEAFSLKVMAKLLNCLSFDKIITYDCHSPVTNALIDNLVEIKQSTIITQSQYGAHRDKIWPLIKSSVVIAPDAGASKKAFETAIHFNSKFAIAEKIRDTSTGEILHTKIDAVGDSAFIIDDICDGGRTFIELAKELRKKGFREVYLFVTHGIFSQGLDVFDGLIDHVFTTDTFRHRPDHKFLTTFNIIGE